MDSCGCRCEAQGGGDCDDKLQTIHFSSAIPIGQKTENDLPDHGTNQSGSIHPKLISCREFAFPVDDREHGNNGIDGEDLAQSF